MNNAVPRAPQSSQFGSIYITCNDKVEVVKYYRNISKESSNEKVASSSNDSCRNHSS